ncbi:Uncharacterised protein [Segatella copri]|nr:Uncharacterised protein [Segatella copri]
MILPSFIAKTGFPAWARSAFFLERSLILSTSIALTGETEAMNRAQSAIHICMVMRGLRASSTIFCATS